MFRTSRACLTIFTLIALLVQCNGADKKPSTQEQIVQGFMGSFKDLRQKHQQCINKHNVTLPKLKDIPSFDVMKSGKDKMGCFLDCMAKEFQFLNAQNNINWNNKELMPHWDTIPYIGAVRDNCSSLKTQECTAMNDILDCFHVTMSNYEHALLNKIKGLLLLSENGSTPKP